jgi:hypothetical protein
MKVNLQKYLKNGSLKAHKSTKKEIESFKKLIARDLKDCAIEEVSVDRRFATAYQAALNLSRMIIIVSNYRVSSKTGHHALTFEIADLILGELYQEYFNFFDVCRRKRNIVDYNFTDVASISELEKLIEKVEEFKRIVYDWLEKE